MSILAIEQIKIIIICYLLIEYQILQYYSSALQIFQQSYNKMYALPTPLIKRTSGQPNSYILGQGYPLYLVIYNNQRMKITPSQMFEIFSKQSYQYVQRKLHLRKWNYRAQFIFQNKNVRNQAIQLIKKIKEKFDVNCYYYFQRGHSTYSLMEQWEYRNAINLANTNPIIVNQIIPNTTGNKRQINQNPIQIQTYPRTNNDEKRAKNIDLQQNLMLEEVQFKKQSSNLSIKRETNERKEIQSESDKQQIKVQLEREQQKIILQGGSQKRNKHKKDRQISVSIQIQRESDRYMLQKQKVRDKLSNKQKYSSKEQKNKINIDNYKANKANVMSEIQIFKQQQSKYRQKQKTKFRKQEDTSNFNLNQSNLMNMQNSNIKSTKLDHKSSDIKPQIDPNIEKRPNNSHLNVQMQEQQGQRVLNESQKKINIIELQIDNQQQPIAVPLNQSKHEKIDLQQNIVKQQDNEDNQFVIPNQQIMQILNNQELVTQILMLEVQIFNFCQ